MFSGKKHSRLSAPEEEETSVRWCCSKGDCWQGGRFQMWSIMQEPEALDICVLQSGSVAGFDAPG
jgi:hypothetical protein